MESNAWERAREAIARAGERDESVITPDSAVSPFDASSTMVIPQAALTRPTPGPRHGAPDTGPPLPRGGHLPPEPPTRPVEVSDPRGPGRVAGARPPTAPFPAPGADARPVPTDPDTEPAVRPVERPAEPPRRSWWQRLLGR